MCTLYLYAPILYTFYILHLIFNVLNLHRKCLLFIPLFTTYTMTSDLSW